MFDENLELTDLRLYAELLGGTKIICHCETMISNIQLQEKNEDMW